ncbi:MAG TPA: NAD(P)/FAD-dependent oxidoreductase [Burkholderiaceae bacterium]|nr:NAD(P)/FAD-dependent oxidoreductase [Burkholderiaceae bacterium]
MSADLCIIGAGSSGIVVAKALLQRGLAFDCFEKGSDIGGMWRYQNDNGMSSAYRSLHIDTSRKSLGYPDFPIPDHMPDFLSHEQTLQYLEDYAAHFGVRERITLRTAVEKLEPLPADRWRVTLAGGESREYRSVIVANGHLWDPRMAEFPGRFDGTIVHSHHYRTADPFRDQRGLVVGVGNSARLPTEGLRCQTKKSRPSTSPSICAARRKACTCRRGAAPGSCPSTSWAFRPIAGARS